VPIVDLAPAPPPPSPPAAPIITAVPPPPPAPPPPPVDEAEERRKADEAYVAAARARRAAEIEASSRGAVEVVMYSTSWCGYCRAARGWLGARGIAYVDHDIEREPAARARMHSINPGGGVPTFEIDGVVAHGFSADSLERLIALAAARRAAH
jgi:glutaredoxin